ncbi:hypothetical protein [Brevibacterium sediminis]|uniref:hypothetical protein n=1 Tax=Brevibacterium sediminis TaxID=1857024 RepID=UPI003B3ADE62
MWLIDGHDPDLGGASFGMRLPEALDDPADPTNAGEDGDVIADDNDYPTDEER